jgi:hypothetical protein
LEGFGYCPKGEGGRFVEGGALQLGGRLPTNTNGGHLSESYMQGWNLQAEAVRQLRGGMGERQIPDAQVIQYLDGEKPKGRKIPGGIKGLQAEVELATRQLVKKQRTWFKNQSKKVPQTRWFQLEKDRSLLETSFIKEIEWNHSPHPHDAS